MGGDKLKRYVKIRGLQAFLRLQVMAWKKRRKVMRKKRGRLFGAVISAVLLTAEIAGVSGIAFGAKPMSAQAANESVMQFGQPELMTMSGFPTVRKRRSMRRARRSTAC